MKLTYILDYGDNFYVVRDNETGKFYYTSDETIEVVPIACISYSIVHDIQKDGRELSDLFPENLCCGEEVTDDVIRYWWFKEKESSI